MHCKELIYSQSKFKPSGSQPICNFPNGSFSFRRAINHVVCISVFIIVFGSLGR